MIVWSPVLAACRQLQVSSMSTNSHTVLLHTWLPADTACTHAADLQLPATGTAQRQVSSISTSSIGQQPGVQQHSLASTAPGQLSF